jgi:hypothetical protein
MSLVPLFWTNTFLLCRFLFQMLNGLNGFAFEDIRHITPRRSSWLISRHVLSSSLAFASPVMITLPALACVPSSHLPFANRLLILWIGFYFLRKRRMHSLWQPLSGVLKLASERNSSSREHGLESANAHGLDTLAI